MWTKIISLNVQCGKTSHQKYNEDKKIFDGCHILTLNNTNCRSENISLYIIQGDRLRIGYLSGSFCVHCITDGRFLSNTVQWHPAN